jgi:hypothetical protein
MSGDRFPLFPSWHDEDRFEKPHQLLGLRLGHSKEGGGDGCGTGESPNSFLRHSAEQVSGDAGADIEVRAQNSNESYWFVHFHRFGLERHPQRFQIRLDLFQLFLAHRKNQIPAVSLARCFRKEGGGDSLAIQIPEKDLGETELLWKPENGDQSEGFREFQRKYFQAFHDGSHRVHSRQQLAATFLGCKITSGEHESALQLGDSHFHVPAENHAREHRRCSPRSEYFNPLGTQCFKNALGYVRLSSKRVKGENDHTGAVLNVTDASNDLLPLKSLQGSGTMDAVHAHLNPQVSFTPMVLGQIPDVG